MTQTNEHRYISGWQALNVQSEKGTIADWHPEMYFENFKPKKLYKFDENSPLKMLGIKERFVPYSQDTYFVANYARAIADLVYYDETRELRGCVKDFLDDDEAKELFDYLKIINKSKNVEEFMKFELTKLYFKDKKCLKTIK